MSQNRISRRSFLHAAAASATAAAVSCAVPSAAACDVASLWKMDLQILASSDTHGKFDPWDYAANKADASGSVAQQATAIKQCRTAHTLVVDSGDTIQANSADLFLKDDLHPMVAAMNAIGYDVWTTGNHEYNYGMDTLSNVELLSLVMNRGAGTKESLQQARQIYNIMGESLRNIKRARIEELEVVQGVGDCKAIAIQAAIELGRRYQMEKVAQQTDLGSSLALYNFLLPQMEDNEKERFFVVLMNQNFRLIKCIKLSEGGLTETAVDVRLIMKEAVLNNATILAVAHNHPSNNATPSKADEEVTLKIHKACQIMRLFFMDHIIITEDGFYSFHDKGKL